MLSLVLVPLLLWSSSCTVFANGKCAHFDIPNVNNNTLTLSESTKTSFIFSITNYSCIQYGDFRLKVAKQGAAGSECALRHANFICKPFAETSCSCTEHTGVYRFVRQMNSSDGVKWRFWVKSDVSRDEDVEDRYLEFSVVSPRTSTRPISSATVTPESPATVVQTKGNTTTRVFTNTVPPLHTPHGEDSASVTPVYFIVGVVGCVIVVVVISSAVCVKKACKARHSSRLPKDHMPRQPTLRNGRPSHLEVTSLFPLGQPAQAPHPAKGAVFQNQVYQNPHVFLVQTTREDDDGYMVLP